jgi:hypothetical protein
VAGELAGAAVVLELDDLELLLHAESSITVPTAALAHAYLLRICSLPFFLWCEWGVR